MIDLWLILAVKSTLVLGAAGVAALVLRRSPADARRLVWLAAMLSLLLLPFGLLLPESVAPAPLRIIAVMEDAPRTALAAGTVGFNAVPIGLTIFWAAGSVLLLTRLITAAVRAARIVRNSEPWPDRASARLRLSGDISSPVTWSFGCGAILLPRGAGQWSETTREAFLAHEEAHLARRDCEALLAAELACALYWFHPLVWYAARRLRIEQEHAADDAVLAAGYSPPEYAGRLVEFARAGREPRLFAGAATSLSVRVAAILDPERKRSMQKPAMVLVSALAALIIALPLGAMQAERKIHRIGDGVSAPVPIHKQEPEYTPEAKEAKIEGAVLFRAVVETDGRFSDIQVLRSLDPGLDKQAMAAMRKWVFKPAQKDGQAVAVSCHVEINFRLD